MSPPCRDPGMAPGADRRKVAVVTSTRPLLACIWPLEWNIRFKNLIGSSAGSAFGAFRWRDNGIPRRRNQGLRPRHWPSNVRIRALRQPGTGVFNGTSPPI